MLQTYKDKEGTKPGYTFAQFSLRLKGLAQARGVSRSGELLSPRRELKKGTVALSRSLA